jgi:hypothetical protein
MPDKFLDDLIEKSFLPRKKHIPEENNVIQRIVLFEKSYKGREMSDVFLRRTKMFYPDIHSVLDRKETQMEDDLIELLQKFQISATRKTNKRSLPFNNVVICDLILESFVAAMFDYEKTYREIISDLIAKNAFKIRFYVHIETYTSNHPFWGNLGGCGVRYCFRYYIH